MRKSPVNYVVLAPSLSAPAVNGGFWHSLESFLGQFYSQSISREICQEFRTDVARSLERLSLDDIERICKKLKVVEVHVGS